MTIVLQNIFPNTHAAEKSMEPIRVESYEAAKCTRSMEQYGALMVRTLHSIRLSEERARLQATRILQQLVIVEAIPS